MEDISQRIAVLKDSLHKHISRRQSLELELQEEVRQIERHIGAIEALSGLCSSSNSSTETIVTKENVS